jgi:NADPH2:quinone reductase
LSAGQLVPAVFEPIYEGLESVARGLGDLEGRRTWGKGVVRIRQDDEAQAKARL